MIILYCIIMMCIACIPVYIMVMFFKSYDRLHRVLEENDIIYCDICHRYLKLDHMKIVEEKDQDPLFLCNDCVNEFYHYKEESTDDRD